MINTPNRKLKSLPKNCRFLLACLICLAPWALAGHRASAQQTDSQGARLTTPRRTPPASRFDYRGEHAGVIYTPSGWRTIDHLDPGLIGANFFAGGRGRGGLSVYVPPSLLEPSRVGDSVVLGSSYEIVRRPRPNSAQPAAGRWEARAKEIVVPGEYVEVYHPAVYEIDDRGREVLVEAEEWTREPKVRLVIEKIWVGGPAPSAAPASDR